LVVVLLPRQLLAKSIAFLVDEPSVLFAGVVDVVVALNLINIIPSLFYIATVIIFLSIRVGSIKIFDNKKSLYYGGLDQHVA